MPVIRPEDSRGDWFLPISLVSALVIGFVFTVLIGLSRTCT